MFLHYWLLWLSAIAAEGKLASPPRRERGPITDKTCGPRTKGNGSVQAAMSGASIFPSCNPWLCAGYQLENENLVQRYAPGQDIFVKYDITRQRTGSANMSVVDTKLNKVLFDQLIYFDRFGRLEKEATSIEFTVTLPQIRNGECQKPGNCVLQLYWNDTGADRTFESCVDFVVTSNATSTPTTGQDGTLGVQPSMQSTVQPTVQQLVQPLVEPGVVVSDGTYSTLTNSAAYPTLANTDTYPVLTNSDTYTPQVSSIPLLPDSSRNLGRVGQQRCLDDQRSRALEIFDTHTRMEELKRIDQAQMRFDATYGTSDYRSPCDSTSYGLLGGSDYAVPKTVSMPYSSGNEQPVPAGNTPKSQVQKSNSTTQVGDRGQAGISSDQSSANHTSSSALVTKQTPKDHNNGNSTTSVKDSIKQNTETKDNLKPKVETAESSAQTTKKDDSRNSIVSVKESDKPKPETAVKPDAKTKVEIANSEAAKGLTSMTTAASKKSTDKVQASPPSVVPSSSTSPPKSTDKAVVPQGAEHATSSQSGNPNKDTAKPGAQSGAQHPPSATAQSVAQHPPSAAVTGTSTTATSTATKPKRKRAFVA